MTPGSRADGWHVRRVRPRLGSAAEPIRPAEAGDILAEVMLARESVVEDAEYQKIVPNQFVVELSPDNYVRNFAPLERQIRQQWREQLLNRLATANSRQGRREYRFAGRVVVETRPAADLEPGHVRILSRLLPDAPGEPGPVVLAACLESLTDGKTWPLRSGIVTLGREASCDIVLDAPRVQELRLVSGQHAYLQCAAGAYRLFDGSPAGFHSVNGTFVNFRPVPSDGQLLQDGDILILAALRPLAPALDTPGVVGLRFRANCE